MRHRVLVVDRDRESRISVKATIADHEVSVVLSASAHDAIARLKRRPFDVVLCARNLSEMDGLTLLEVEKEKYPDTHFILLDADPSIGGAVEAMRRGATNYLPKPVEPALLREVIGEILERRDLAVEVEYLKGLQ